MQESRKPRPRGRFRWCVIGLRDGPDEPCPVEYCLHRVEDRCEYSPPVRDRED